MAVEFKPGDSIAICVACVHLNKMNGETLPIRCPKTKMPCFALDPERIQAAVSNSGDIPEILNQERGSMNNPIFDQNFINVYLNAWDDLYKNEDARTTLQIMERY